MNGITVNVHRAALSVKRLNEDVSAEVILRQLEGKKQQLIL